MITEQEMFDRVVAGLAGQGWVQSLKFAEHPDETSATCMYRGPNGTKCAFGHLIPDELYSEKMEGFNCRAKPLEPVWVHLTGDSADSAATPAVRELRSLAGDLQDAHDNGGDVLKPSELQHRIRNIADKYGLNKEAFRA